MPYILPTLVDTNISAFLSDWTCWKVGHVLNFVCKVCLAVSKFISAYNHVLFRCAKQHISVCIGEQSLQLFHRLVQDQHHTIFDTICKQSPWFHSASNNLNI